jgi:tetratricopeptide (TPR) repeat protein
VLSIQLHGEFMTWLATMFRRVWRRERPDREAELVAMADAVERADLLALQGGWDRARELAEVVLERARSQPAGAVETLVRARLVLGDCAGGVGDVPAARAHFEAAGPEIMALADPMLRSALEWWRVLGSGGLDPAHPPGGALAAPGDPDGQWTGEDLPPGLRIRLARHAAWRAQIENQHGSWKRARRWFEWSFEVGEQVAPPAAGAGTDPSHERAQLLWSLARARSSASAVEIGEVLWSLGEREEATRWFDRAIGALEGAEQPFARVALARALIVRSMHEPSDPLTGDSGSVGFLERARDVALGASWPLTRVLAARAEIRLAGLRAEEGATDRAIELLRTARDRVQDLGAEGAADLIAEAHVMLGHLYEERDEFDAARAAYRLAFETGRADADPDARRLAVVAGCHLHRLLHAADRPAEAAALLEPLDSMAPTLSPPGRTLLAALVSRSRGHQQFRDGDREAADRTLRRGEGLAQQTGGPEAADLLRQLATERGNLALANARPEEAEGHFLRALATPSGTRGAGVESAERAEILLHLAQARMRLERDDEALADLRAAFERGRDSGRAQGRSVAAVAALLLADSSEAPREERRQLYESAARLGTLSGTERGREVAAAVVERLRELAE